MFKCPLTNKSNSAVIKSPKTRKFWMATYIRNIASIHSSYVTQNSVVRISISSRVRHLFISFNTCKRLGSGLPSACERLGSIGLKQICFSLLTVYIYELFKSRTTWTSNSWLKTSNFFSTNLLFVLVTFANFLVKNAKMFEEKLNTCLTLPIYLICPIFWGVVCDIYICMMVQSVDKIAGRNCSGCAGIESVASCLKW